MAENLVKYNKTTLRNGLRIISEKVPSARSVSIGIWIDVGSRDEREEENGISHFIEHMLFKGTKTRSAKNIASTLESLGGNLNAFTSREQTCYVAIILDEHLEEAMDVLADILMNSTLKQSNVEREKSVIIEEIHEVRENPTDLVHELFSDCFWRGQPLGRSILGTKQSIQSFRRSDLKAYINNHYLSGRIVVAAAGNVSHRKLVKLVRTRFDFPIGSGNRGKAAIAPVEFDVKCFTNSSSQNHICIGFPGIEFSHPDRYSLLGLYTYLGSGMSSVLFQKIREEKGMAYSIYAFADFFRDSGLLGIYFGTDRARLQEAVETTLKELKKVKKNRLSQDKLDKIKAQIKGHLTLALESTNGRMGRLGRQELLAGEYTSLEDSLRTIDRLSSDDLIEVARKVFRTEGLTVTSLGPGTEEDLNGIDFSIL